MRARCSGIGRVVRRCRARSPISTLPRSRRRMQAKYVGFSTQDLTDSVSWWPGAGCGMMLCEVGVDHLSGPGIGTNGALYFSTWFGCMYHVVRASMAQGVYLNQGKQDSVGCHLFFASIGIEGIDVAAALRGL
ncbi:uncharacterized protein LOC124669838 isoform X2 [Lolium rigidum]|uniref:uncharacterized protein LOC124669838 isoform X2 n=1 Tax=Lolium rigidum TaxID=89674 RepID=UPI001F5C5BED|nr:uncharacterized protein LOC124669838 isoform X2 [Lolium rigidum]